MAIFDVIKYDGDTDDLHWLIYKCESDQFVLGSQLIVNQGQEAIFFRGGEALDIFKAGTYTLNSGNLPILKRFVNKPFGGKTPFSAEIYFINKTDNLNLKWGTATPIPLEDAKCGIIIHLCARGQYGVFIENSRLFVARIIGAIPNGSKLNQLMVLRYFNGLINTKIKSVIAKFMINEKVSFLEITQYLSELSELFEQELRIEFHRFGIKLTNFYCESIAPQIDDYKKLKQYKEELALGSEFYQQRRYWDVLDKMAANQLINGNLNAEVKLESSIEKESNKFEADLDMEVNDQQIVCPKCGRKNSYEMNFCGYCGQNLKMITCPICGTINKPDMNYCGKCGKKLK